MFPVHLNGFTVRVTHVLVQLLVSILSNGLCGSKGVSVFRFCCAVGLCIARDACRNNSYVFSFIRSTRFGARKVNVWPGRVNHAPTHTLITSMSFFFEIHTEELVEWTDVIE